LVWGPVNKTDNINLDNLMYIVQLNGTNTLAVVIRGTVYPHNLSTLFDLYEDWGVGNASPWLYPPVPRSLVAGGTLFGLDSLTNMIDSTGRTAFDLLNSFASPTIYVTGHSLGGCLTTVLAPWLLYKLSQADNAPTGIYPYTFAAPTAGNAAFAAWYNATFPISARYYNELDVVPKAWNNLEEIKDLFPPGPACPWTIKAAVDLVTSWLKAVNVGYTQTNGPGSSLPGMSKQSPDWFMELNVQHESNCYLKLLGAPTIATTNPVQLNAHADALMVPLKPV
jgi:triacylglycerol lipase